MIPASHIVKVTPRVISGGSSDIETNGLLLTKSNLLPADKPAKEFSSASAVADFFGAEAEETIFAQQYFTGATNQQKAVSTLVVGRFIAEAVPAWIRGGAVATSLASFKAVTDGTITIRVNGSEVVAENIDLSGVTSMSEVAETVANAIAGVKGAYDSNAHCFVFTSEKTGADAKLELCGDAAVKGGIVGEAIVGESHVASEGHGTKLDEALGMSVDQGAIASPGAEAQTPAAALENVCAVTRNWVGFTTMWEASLEEAEGFAAWADIDDDYVYVDWTTDVRCLNTLTQADTKPAKMVDKYNCAICLYGKADLAAFVLAVGASIDWQRYQGMKVWFAKSASGLSATVQNEAAADALEKIRCSYFGNFATRNDAFQFMNTGALCSDLYGFIDVLYGSIYLRNTIQRSCMDGFKSVNRAPYNDMGRAYIAAWLQDPISLCLRNGVIDPGLDLSESQRVQILQEVGDDISTTLFTKGYWYGIEMPSANVRAQRGSPVITLYYCYAGGIQRADIEAVAVI